MTRALAASWLLLTPGRACPSQGRGHHGGCPDSDRAARTGTGCFPRFALRQPRGPHRAGTSATVSAHGVRSALRVTRSTHGRRSAPGAARTGPAHGATPDRPQLRQRRRRGCDPGRGGDRGLQLRPGPRRAGPQGHPSSDEVLTQIVPLEFINAQDAVNLLRPFVPQEGAIAPPFGSQGVVLRLAPPSGR